MARNAKDLTIPKKEERKILKKAQEAERTFNVYYRVPIPQGYKEVPEKFFHERKRELQEIATGPITRILKKWD